MKKSALFKGVIPPISILFDEKGNFDKEGQKKVVDFLINAGVDGLFFLGSSGEFANMSIDTRKEIAEFAVAYVNKRVPVLIGIGTTSTKETIDLGIHAKHIGADGVVVINPYYYKLNDKALFQHYASIAENVDLPIILYNFPALTGQDLSPQFLLNLAKEYPNISGVKDTISDVGHTREIIQTVKREIPSFGVYCGFDDHFLNTLANGGDGSIGLTANFAPEIQVNLYKAYKEKNFDEVIKNHKIIADLVSLYALDSPFLNLAKDALRLRGLDVSTTVIPPVTELSEDKKAYLEKFLKTVLPEYFN